MTTPSIDLTSLTPVPGWAYAMRCLPSNLRGKVRLARTLLRPLLDHRHHTINANGRSFSVPSLHEPVAFNLLIHGEYEPELLRFLEMNLTKDSTFVDVGANVGLFSIIAGLSLCPDGRVLSLEASPSVYPYLEHNRASNKVENMICRHCAVAGEDGGTIPFYEANTDKFGMGSLAPQFDGNVVNVPRATLGTILKEEGIEKVSVIKVDVEGYEAGVFNGATELLSSDDAPAIVFEFQDWAEERAEGYSPGDAQEVLRSIGYNIYRLSDYLAGGTPLDETVTTGYADLVATKA